MKKNQAYKNLSSSEMKCGVDCRCGMLPENSHKMPDGTIMSGKTHNKNSKVIKPKDCKPKQKVMKVKVNKKTHINPY